ncbi:RHS repeat-associated core domain-containing protein [Chryseobacterium luquanense]|uniref:Type IV secretion protein Rhs n=1 Tax=Chryseobacterium luquanense TaxID=2983766 RepID=A0ABT3XY86_9FLAO|nr:RHS repeat-associated core domain-containing protein [Chryseobacterium luquanense]MCX8530807.1 type IV secretion protein Rhs [Chryseobacterium luquanense]
MKKNFLFIALLLFISNYAQSDDKFHDTKGSIDVNSGGQLQYTLPIALPPGVKTVAPQVNLSYTSGSGNGTAGYGWNVGGITAVSRVSRNIEKDNEIIGVQSDYSDLYSFNGQRLILKSGEYGKDGAVYATEKFSNLKIKSYGSIAGKPWQGPAYWEITFEDGSQAWYGTIPNLLAATTDLQYNIVKWKDTSGNIITYEYDQTDLNSHNISLIKSIKWGGNENLNKPNFNTINFNYIDRIVKETAYHQGILHTQQSILKEIIVLTNQSQFRRYEVDYIDNGTSYQFINKITEYNSLNEPANPVSFTHAPNQMGSEETSYHHNITNFNTKKYADFNMDGVADFIEFVSVGVINYKSSVYASVSPISLQYDSSKFSANDFKNAVPVTFKNNNYVKNKVGLVIPVPKATSVSYKKNYEFQVYSINIQNQSLDFEYSKTIDYDSYTPLVFDDELGSCNNPSIVIKDAVSYDFNGDGVSELVMKFQSSRICGGGLDPGLSGKSSSDDVNESDDISNSKYNPSIDQTNTELGYDEVPEPINIIPGQTFQLNYSYVLIDLDQNIAVPQSVYNFDNGIGGTANSLKFADFNGDGIQEIIIQINSQFNRVLNIKRDLALNYSTATVGNFEGQNFVGSVYNAMLFGDFNGDSKMDILVPQANKSYNWDLYTSTGKSFIKSYINNFVFYQAGTETLTSSTHNTFYESGCTYGMLRMFQYQTGDLDGDGKSEVIVSNVLLYDHEWNAHRDQEWTTTTVAVYSTNKLTGAINKSIVYNPSQSGPFGVTYYALYNTDNSSPIQTNSEINFFRTKYWLKGFNEKVIPFSTLSLNRENQQIILTGKPVDCQGAECDQNYVLHYNYTFLPTIAKITHIKQGDVTTIIDYKSINSYADSNFYKTIQSEPYPYMELDQIPMSSVVSKLSQFTNSSLLLSQDFRYRGLLSNYHGRGMVGFRQIAKSSWYASGFENTKIWSGVEIHLLNESVPLKEWAIRTNDESKIFPVMLTESNNELLSLKVNTYKVEKIINGQVSTTVADIDKPKVVNATLLETSRSKDFLKGIITENSTVYGDYYLPTQNISNTNNGFAISTDTYEYYNNISGQGSDYYIGRLKNKITTAQVYNDTKTSKEEYTYDSNLIKTLKSWNRDNTHYLQESFDYDGFGNVLGKTISNSIDSQTKSTSVAFDTMGRFVIQRTDNLGLINTINYNSWGQITSQIDPQGNSTTSNYDGWGKILNTTSNLSGTSSYDYEKLSGGAGIKVQETNPVGNKNITYTNNIGQKFKTITKAFNQGQYVVTDFAYDAMGRQISESEPYYEGQSASQWNTVEYNDNYYPPIAIATSFNGKKTETVISGLTTTVSETNGYLRTTSKTTDAIGNVISSTDKGGFLQFMYNAAGEQTKAIYGTNIVETKYDVWGRKSEFNDPSNGKYLYEYDGLGNIKKIVSPKGLKQYSYNNLGQLITQIETSSDGISTNKNITLGYDSFGRLISKSGTANGKHYNSNIEFDTYGRVKSNVENSNGRTFTQKGFFYDEKSRIKSYTKSLQSSGILTEVTIMHAYNDWNGQLYQLKDKKTGLVLWELQNTNVKGQTLTSKLGTSTINNLYSVNGFLTSTNHSSAVKPGILQISYTFDAIKNELTNRTTGGDFNILESFTYDDNNRLISWTDPRTGLTSSNVYDVKGRITVNDQLGQVKYENSNKIYQSTGIDLNPAGVQNYTNDLIQYISYNENNDPIHIDGLKGDVGFQYGLTAMRQRVTYGGNFEPNKDGKYTKLYNEDGSFEITIDNKNKVEKHVLYIAGEPYESSILFVKNYKDTNASYKFLHKDYLGSILAVSDAAGYKIEQRHFDAWGNITHLQIGTGSVLTDKNSISDIISKSTLIVDRGFTSHEHFVEVGIIHMNGRLYDPLLRRFLNADQNIQEPFNTQNYNKYGYVLNNPLMFNDPSGEIFGIGETLVSAIVIGAIIGTAGYVVGALITGEKITLAGLFKASTFGAISGAVTFGIGSIFTSTAGAATQFATSIGRVGSAFLQAAAHGIAQGTLSLMQGGTHQSGMISGFLGSIGASAFGMISKEFAKSAGGMVLSGAVLGGVGAELTGGNFWQGALIGGVVAGLNHGLHRISENLAVDKTVRKQFRAYVRNKDYQCAFELVNSQYNLDSGIEGKYTMTYADSDKFSGLTGGEANSLQEVTIAKHVFNRSVAVFARVVHHEFVHVFQRAVMGMAGNLGIYEVREFLAYHDTIFNNSLPSASFSSMEGYWSKAKQFYNYMTANPTLIKAYQLQYNDFRNTEYFNR